MMRSLIAALAVFVAAVGFTAGAQDEGYPSGSQEELGTGGAGEAQKERNLFDPSLAFDVQGTLGEKDGSEWEIERANLPPLKLELKDRTKVTLNGQPAQREALSQGMSVRARFQIDEDEIVGVSIEAERPEGGLQK